MKIAAIAITALLCACGTARADWQYTKWGMTEAELKAVSPNITLTTAKETKDHSNPYIGESRFKSGYSASDIQFTAYYWFRSGKLVAVELDPVNLKDAPRLNLMMEKIYGAPTKDASRTLGGGSLSCSVIDRQWRDEGRRNLVRLSSMTCSASSEKDFASTRYEPLLSGKETGL
jgi:hypothetical protein